MKKIILILIGIFVATEAFGFTITLQTEVAEQRVYGLSNGSPTYAYVPCQFTVSETVMGTLTTGSDYGPIYWPSFDQTDAHTSYTDGVIGTGTFFTLDAAQVIGVPVTSLLTPLLFSAFSYWEKDHGFQGVDIYWKLSGTIETDLGNGMTDVKGIVYNRYYELSEPIQSLSDVHTFTPSDVEELLANLSSDYTVKYQESALKYQYTRDGNGNKVYSIYAGWDHDGVRYIAPVPEPSTLLLLASGLLGLAGYGRKKFFKK